MRRLACLFACGALVSCGPSGTPGAGSAKGAGPSSSVSVASAPSQVFVTAPATSEPEATSTAPRASEPSPSAAARCDKECLGIEKCEAGKCVPACPPNEVYVPPTPKEGFTMGRGKIPYGFGKMNSGNPGTGIADEPHNVVLTKPFCMDATEVTVKAISKCIAEQGCRKPSIFDRFATYPNKPDYPVNMVEWDIAQEYCEKQGQSLPTEAQWEWAATGGDGRDYPWGNEMATCEHADFTLGVLPSPGGDAGCHGGGPSPPGTHPKGDRVWPTGRIHDLAGNVWEWTLDSYARFTKESQVDPLVKITGDATHVVKGGGWNRSHKGIMSWFRGAAIHTYKVPGLGFRCVRNP